MISYDLINGQDGPFWEAYQAAREKGQILDDPDRVPNWFLTKTAVERVHAARVELEQHGAASHREAWAALGKLYQTITWASDDAGMQAVATILLGGEVPDGE